MRIRELSLRNYRVFEEVELELPARVIGIFGANGSGKSSLIESILFALYGSARTAKDQVRTHGVLTECAVRLVFEHGGQQYEVRRLIKGKNHQVEAELLAGETSLAVGVREVDAEVRRLLRMDRRVFGSSVFAEQKQLDAFSDLTKTRRKEMVLRLLGIKPVDDARSAARRSAREERVDADRLAATLPDATDRRARLEAVREVLEKARAGALEASEQLQEARRRLQEAQEAFREADRAREEAGKLSGLLAAAEEEAGRLETRKRDLVGRIEELRAELSELPGLEDEAEALEGARDALEVARRWTDLARELREAEDALAAGVPVHPGEALAERAAAQEALREAEAAALRAEAAREQAGRDLAAARGELAAAGELDPSKPCPTCGQPLGDAFRDVVAHHEEEVRRLEERLKTVAAAADVEASKREQAAARFEASARKAEEATRAADARSSLEARVSELRARLGSLKVPFEGEPDLEELQRRARRATEVLGRVAALRERRLHLERAERDLATAETDLASALGKARDLAEHRDALGFDPAAHAVTRERLEESRGAEEQAAREEREASDAAKDAEKEMAALEADLRRIEETAERVDALREDARYGERVALLLDGFRDHLVSRIGPELSREAEALFRELTNHEYEDLKIDDEDLSIHIADGGAWFPIERFSGSETDLANLALRVAISVHLSRVSGADIGMMVLDEVLGSLDAERKDLMVQAMGRLSNRFHQLFVITHAEQVKDQFAAGIEVRKVGRRRSEAVLA